MKRLDKSTVHSIIIDHMGCVHGDTGSKNDQYRASQSNLIHRLKSSSALNLYKAFSFKRELHPCVYHGDHSMKASPHLCSAKKANCTKQNQSKDTAQNGHVLSDSQNSS